MSMGVGGQGGVALSVSSPKSADHAEQAQCNSAAEGHVSLKA